INDFIQVKSPLAEIAQVVATPTEGNEIAHGGHDGLAGTDDDLVVVFDVEGKRTDLRFAGRETLDGLLAQIEERIAAAGFEAPSNAQGDELVAATFDPWGNPYQYRLFNRNRLR